MNAAAPKMLQSESYIRRSIAPALCRAALGAPEKRNRCLFFRPVSSFFGKLSTGYPQMRAIMLTLLLVLLSGCALCGSFVAVKASRDTQGAVRLLGERLAELQPETPLTPAQVVQLAELKDALERTEDLLTRVNRREIARAKKREADGTYALPLGNDKDALRRLAGLRAGHPAPHR